MNTGTHGMPALTSPRASFGCVDWYPYDRHPSDAQPEMTRTPEASALAASRATGRALTPAPRPAGLLKGPDDVLIHP
jgi:hypothetical protein